MAGFTPQAIQAALPGVLNMALAGGVELGETADIAQYPHTVQPDSRSNGPGWRYADSGIHPDQY